MTLAKLNFSLVTTCWNEMASLPHWKADIEAQTRKPDEILIVDNLSTDGTQEFLSLWAKSNPTIQVYEIKCNVAKGRNIAIERSTNEHVVSTDMGVRLKRTWFAEIVRPFEEDSGVQIVMGSYAVDKSTVKSPAARAEYYINGDYIPFLIDSDGVAILKRGFVPGNLSLAYTKMVWKTLGGLPEDLTLAADDSVFGRQMLVSGFKIAFAPDAAVLWPRHNKLKEYWKEAFRYGKGDGEAAIKTPIAFKLYKKGALPHSFVPFVTAIRELSKLSFWKTMGKSLIQLDFAAFIFLPLLVFGKGYNLAKGYLIGDEHGSIHCIECRNRLKK